jgi:maltose phosphorylase
MTGFSIGADVKPGERVTLIKYTAVLSSLYYDRQLLVDEAVSESKKAKAIGWDALVNEHKKVWEDIWNETDVIIDGDPEAQQRHRRG